MSWRRKITVSDRLRIYFATDLHGSQTCFGKFLNAKDFYGVDALILGGDLAGKSLVPIESKGNDTWEVTWQNRRELIESRAGLANLQRQIRRTGCYDVVVDAAELARLEQEPSHLADVFMQQMKQRLMDWVNQAEEKLSGKIPCYTMLGNDDPQELDQALDGSSVLVNAEDEIVDLPGGYQLASCGVANTTPWRMPRDVPEAELSARIDAMVGGIADLSRTIFSFHAPPHDTELDQAPLLDDDFRPVTGSNGGVVHVGVGSTAVRDRIAYYQPLLSLHGHIHECSAMATLGRTVALNPGSEYQSGVLRGAIIELRGSAKPHWQLVQG